MATANYTREEERQLAAELRAGGAPLCPRCGAGLEARRVPPKKDLPYVRDRTWFVCPGCGRSLVLDRRRLEGGA